MGSIEEEIISQKQLAIVEKYDSVVAYLYPVFHNIKRNQSVLRGNALACLFEQVRLFIDAGKTNQVSKLYQADANLALLRWYLRFMADSGRRVISLHQHQVASILIAEVGNLLGAWIRSRR